ncbi:MAG: GMC family oxidoreductase [Alphaproteobacteria bacterium]|nr:GMC family oxidoreductase [Alphaproteobacteria bacterium]
MSSRIETFADHGASRELTCDVCIVGSGAGGAVVAAGLAEAGLDVVILEEGSHLGRRDFTLHEGDAYPAMYQERGSRATADAGITILQGRSVGGSTTINWTTCFRTPERILAHWARHHGLDGLDLDAHFAAVEARLSIAPWPVEPNANNSKLREGAEALGWSWEVLRRNVNGCANSGYCGLGCPVDGKQGMGITYLPDALAAGARVLANVRVERLETAGGKVVAVHGRAMSAGAPVPDGPAIVVRPKVVVTACGAINGPALLLRSGLDAGGLVGRRTFLHPVLGAVGWYPERVNPFWGAPQSVGSHEHIDRGPDRMGYFFEAAPMQPMLSAVALGLYGDELHELMRELPHLSALIALAVDGLLPGDEGGVVRLGGEGRPVLDYPIGPALQEAWREATVDLVRLHLAAGAELVGTPHVPLMLIRTEAELDRVRQASYASGHVTGLSAHQMGGCAMGSDPARHVVDAEHRFRGVPNLFVVDGSVLPTALGVNPSETIYALAHRARRFVGEAV